MHTCSSCLYMYIPLYTVYNPIRNPIHTTLHMSFVQSYRYLLPAVAQCALHWLSGPCNVFQESTLAGSTCRGSSYAECRSVKLLQPCCGHSPFVVKASCMICTPSFNSTTLKARQTSYTSACILCFVHVSVMWCC